MATNGWLRFCWAAGVIPVILAGLLFPHGRFLQANSQGVDDWEIELVPRSAGPAAQLVPPRRERDFQRPQGKSGTTSSDRDESQVMQRSGPLTPAQKGWVEVEATATDSERAVPLNAAVRRSGERAQPLSAVVSNRRSALQSDSAIRSVSTSRSTAGRQSSETPAEASGARLLTPRFARREAAKTAEANVAEAAVAKADVAEASVAEASVGDGPPMTIPDVAEPAAVRPATGLPRATASVSRSPVNSVPPQRPRRSMAPASQRPLAGELPEAVVSSERAEPLNVDSSRSVASAAVRRRSTRTQTSMKIADGGETSVADVEAERTQVIAPNPQRSEVTRHSGSAGLDSIPFAGHSLFVDPLPLAPTFTGRAPAYPAAPMAHDELPMIPDSRYGRNPGNSFGPPYVMPRHAISHTGWYGPGPGVRSISHSAAEPSLIPGHSLRDR